MNHIVTISGKLHLLLLALLLTTAAAPAGPEAAALERARRESLAAAGRLSDEAARAVAEAARARRERAEVESALTNAAATERDARARLTAAEERRETVRLRLARAQAPLMRLTAALQRTARRPAGAALLAPGAVGAIVHRRALLEAALPQLEKRAAGVREALAEATALEADARAAATALAERSTKLAAEQRRLAALDAEESRRADALLRQALGETDRALLLEQEGVALGRRAAEREGVTALRRQLAALPAPLPPPRPLAPAEMRFALPVNGRIVTGLGTVSEEGLRARGPLLASAAGATVRAPADGRVAWAGRLRGQGGVVLIDHGEGWASALTGLNAPQVSAGQRVDRGDPIGRAGGPRPRIGFELSSDGRPVDPLAPVGSR